ncbi:MAG: VOC family protein, partial [Bacteroidota bacterium]
MKPRLNIVTLGVSDLQRSKIFYRDALGWEPAKGSDENIVFYNQNGIILSLYPIEKLAEDAGVPAKHSGFAGITLSINQKNKEGVDEVFKQAIKNGAKDLIKPHETFWGGYG